MITAFETIKAGKAVTLNISNNVTITSENVSEILATIVKAKSDINVVFDAELFYKPLLKLMPKEVSSKLEDGQAALWLGFRLWFGRNRHSRTIGITYREFTKGNFCNKYEIEIYEVKQYYSDIDKATLAETVALTNKVLKAFSDMGIITNKLTSAASVYKESVLDKLGIPSMTNSRTLPDDKITDDLCEAQELSKANWHEWVATYKSMDTDNLFSYDITAAYPSALSELHNLRYAVVEHLTEIPPAGYAWGIMNGTIHNKTLVSPLIKPDIGRPYIGYWQGTMNLAEYGSCLQWGIADFEFKDGYFIRFDKYLKLFDYSMRKLYSFRNGDKLKNELSKAMAVSVWGKFLEEHNGVWGDFYNPLYADMVTTYNRIKVTDFIYKNQLQDSLVEVNRDGIKATKELDITTTRQFGEWRKNKKQEVVK